MNERSKFTLIGYVVLVLVAVLSTFLAIYFVNNTKQTNTNTNDEVPININAIDLNNLNISTEPTDFEKYIQLKNNSKSITVNAKRIISPQFTSDNQEENNKIALNFLQSNSLTLVSTGKITSGYLYIKAGAGTTDDVGPLSPKESTYIYLGNKGGHLFRPKSLVSTPSEEGYTQYLYDLKNIAFTSIPYSDDNRSNIDDWLERLNVPGNNFIGGFVSSTRFGVIEEITIAYDGDGELTIR